MSGAPARRGVSLTFLDGLRGLAAVYVMLGHARWLLWEGMEGFQQHAASYSALGRAMVYGSALFRFGHEAVLFFFVLSGFVIHLRYARQLATTPAAARFDGGSYAWRRARRLYPPLIGAMLLTFACDRIGIRQGYAIYLGCTPYSLLNANILPVHDWATALGNLAFLMTAFVPCWGTDGPLWSLHFEGWLYLSYPVLWLLTRRSLWLATMLVAVLFALSALAPALLGPAWLSAFFLALLPWWLGALLADIYTGRWRMRFSRLAGPVVLLAALPLMNLPQGGLHDFLWSLGFAGLIALCFVLGERGAWLRPLERLKAVGEFSYTLYVTHFPLLVLFSGWLMSRSRTGELPSSFGFCALGVVVTLLFAWAAHFALERPFLSPARKV